MHHKALVYIRNAIIIIIALSIAGYPYLLYTGYIFQNTQEYAMRSVIVIVVLLLAFVAVAYAAHYELERQRQAELQKLN